MINSAKPSVVRHEHISFHKGAFARFSFIASVSRESVHAAPFQGGVVGWGHNVAGEATGVPSYISSNGLVIPVGNPCATGVVRIASREITNIVMVAAGMWHSLGIRADGSVVAWGGNIVSEGVGYKTPWPHVCAGEVRLGGRPLRNIVALAAGWGFSLALKKDGSVVGWGRSGQRAEIVPRGLKKVVAISAGHFHSLALLQDGTVRSWGSRSNVFQGFSNIVAVAASRNSGWHDVALLRDGTVIDWLPSNPSWVPKGLSNVIAIASGAAHVLALRSDGTVFGWGANGVGQATGVPRKREISDLSIDSGSVTLGGILLTDVVSIAAADNYSLALRKDSTVVGWGRMQNDARPVDVPQGLTNFTAIAAGDFFNLAITSNIPRLGY